ncbi:HAMP domain-containing sensor histidine kinase [Clostridium sp.]|uniref:HAMP domain-containing sensor histidine kinase n=1 Tax=Clostridium sp. TaxID=1506 RepID=UPI002626504C|nr:HAMP domain-containing sensor histidine kinase [Clostridium sp.]
MNLSKKTFIYSSILSGIILSFILIYFIIMLPSLYIDYQGKSNYQAVKEIHKEYIKNKNYDNIHSPNPTATISIRIPSSGSDIYASNIFGTAKINIIDNNLNNLLDELRYYSKNMETLEVEDSYFERIFDTLKNSFNQDVFLKELPVKIEFTESNVKNVFNEGTSKMNILSDETVLYESNSFDGINYFTAYFAITIDKGDIVVSLLSVMTPKIEDVRSIVLQSLPMIIAVLILILLIFTYFFSRKIIIPIKKLADHAEFIKENNINEASPIEIKGEDEIAVLGNILNELYSKLNQSFIKLEEKNKLLVVENKRQDIFLRASSHHLKTPVAAALLLVEGMIDEVGKFKNTKEYLPKVKYQLLSIRKIIDEILDLNNKAVNKKVTNISLLIDEILSEHEIGIKQKFININFESSHILLDTDYHLIYKIIDNLITNAINYTNKNNDIRIILSEEKLEIINYGAYIDEELLPNIFDAFVSSNSESRGRGLGLYIAYYYATLLGYKIEIDNINSGVKAIVYFKN